MKTVRINERLLIRVPIITLLVIILASCGGGGSGGFVKGIGIGTPESPTFDDRVDIGISFILGDVSTNESRSSETLQINWRNKTTGESGSLEHSVSRHCTWSVVFIFPIPTCTTSGQYVMVSLYLAMGNNQIEVKAGRARKSFSVQRVERTTAPPTGVTVQSRGYDVIVTWNNFLPRPDHYNIYYASSPGVNKSNYSGLPNGNKITRAVSPQPITGLAAGTDYYFVVTWQDSISESEESQEVSASTVKFSLNFDTKTFRFTWTDEPNATHYRILENPDGYSGYSQVGGDIPRATEIFDHIVPLYKRGNASYILQSCNDSDCTDDGPLYIGSNLIEAIGYFKADRNSGDFEFGTSVSLSDDGNTLAVGAPGMYGQAVYVYGHDGSDWSQQARVETGNSATGDKFGASISLSADGNTFAVGAPGENGQAGAVYVYSLNGNVWEQQAYLEAGNAGAGDKFGTSVSLSDDGNTLAVGATDESSSTRGINTTPDDSMAGAGAVYVFSRTGSAWSQQAYLKSSNTGYFHYFGTSVSLSGDGNVLAAGAIYEGNSPGGISDIINDWSSSSGAVYVFSRSGGNWGQQAYVTPANTHVNDRFGTSVSLSSDGNTLAIGAIWENSSTVGINTGPDDQAAGSGAAYVYSHSGGNWSQQAYVKASNTESFDFFGTSISLSGDGNTLAVGAVNENSGTSGINTLPDESLEEAGAAYVYSRSGNDWAQQAYVKASNTDSRDYFGTSISLSSDGDTLAVGARGERSSTTGINGNQANNSAWYAGAVYLY